RASKRLRPLRKRRAAVQLDFDDSISRLLTHEGGYTNDPKDPGGPTNYGITIYDARAYAKEFGWIADRKVMAQDVKAMQLWFAQKVWKAKYWDAMRCDELPAGVDDCVFDYGGNSGIGRSGRVLRRVVGMDSSTSVINAAVIDAANRRPAKAIVDAICDERL